MFINNYCIEKNLIPLPEYICDNNERIWGTEVAGVPIVSPSKLKDEGIEETVIVMAQVLPFTMLDSLHSCYEVGGLQRYYHFMMPLCQLETYFFYKENCERIKNTYEKLADKKSKYAYRKYFRYLMEGNLTFPTIFTGNAYWENDVIGALEDNSVVVYAGAYDGKHLDRALKSNSRIELHGFEPNRNCAALLEKKYQQLPNVHIHRFGLSDKPQKMYFDNTTGTSAMTVSETSRPEREYDIIEVEQMDNILTGRIDLIALDIEGDEVRALRGAKRIIYESKPVLAICVYHRIEHYVEVAETIQQICPGYDFYFRQHSIVPHESVLYAIYKGDSHE